MSKDTPNKIWSDFRAAFTRELDDVGTEKLHEAWTTVQDKTVFYEKIFMPKVAERLGFELWVERMRCDYMFVNPDKVPLVAAECENSHPSAWQEIEVLCRLSAPVKALVLSCDWSTTEKKKFQPQWAEIIRKHHSVIFVECLYAIIVGEWVWESEASPTYSFTLLDTSGRELEQELHTAKVAPV